jgi:DNA-directed RNA polymerase subunit RPC12/RpoP
MLDTKTKTDIIEMFKDWKECSICREPFDPTIKAKANFNASQYACPDCTSRLFTRDTMSGSFRGDSTLDD